MDSIMNRKGSGILLAVTSLPSPFGIGDMGPSARRFVDFLQDSGQQYWQILPLNPTRVPDDNSPYLGSSAFAGNVNLISPELMARDGFLDPSDIVNRPLFPADRVDYDDVTRYKQALLDQAFRFSFSRVKSSAGYRRFCYATAGWLDDHATFQALATHYGKRSWSEWPRGIKFRHQRAMAMARKKLRTGILKERFLQYIFFSQWEELHRYCRSRGILLIGDLPIYVSYESADVWADPGLFQLDDALKPTAVAGVPPDYFSSTGQLWKNPLYRWEEHRRTGFGWWIRRLAWNSTLCDLVRIDHFRGLVAYWEVPAGARDATGGRWVKAPAGSLLRAMKKTYGQLPFVAEDLGVITPDVRAVLRRYNLPGMRVLQFAFTGKASRNPHFPRNLKQNMILYTGTHDNPPAREWFESAATPEEKEQLHKYLGRECTAGEIPGIFIRCAMMSGAGTVIVPMQDILGLGAGARMNLPGTKTGNWQWRMSSDQLEGADRSGLLELTRRSGRAGGRDPQEG